MSKNEICGRFKSNCRPAAKGILVVGVILQTHESEPDRNHTMIADHNRTLVAYEGSELLSYIHATVARE